MSNLLLLYSVNPLIKYNINEIYFNSNHYVWCSECFDASKQDAYNPRFRLGATSNPIDIYRDYYRAVNTHDAHNLKINSQRTELISLATRCHSLGKINNGTRDEIISYLSNADLSFWRPLIYLIPRTEKIEERMIRARPSDTANGIANEYIIQDLKCSEFDIMEF